MSDTAPLTSLTAPRTLAQTFAALLRAVARWIDGAPAPTIEQVREVRAYEVEMALLDAQAESERYSFTVGMLRERLRRLRSPTP